jgi:hypothetical protein
MDDRCLRDVLGEIKAGPAANNRAQEARAYIGAVATQERWLFNGVGHGCVPLTASQNFYDTFTTCCKIRPKATNRSDELH